MVMISIDNTLTGFKDLVYQNCGDHVTEKIVSILPLEEWRKKRIVIYSFTAVARTAAAFFLNNGITPIIVDHERTDLWVGIQLIKPHEIIPSLTENDIIIKAAEDAAIDEEVIRLNPTMKNCIIDLSRLDMEYIPNALVPPGDAVEIDLPELQAELIELLEHFHNFCTEHNLTYYLDSGTLLGAIRHKGFIPWDDDLDVTMPVKDYFRFCELYKSNDKYLFQSLFSDDKTLYTPSTVTKITLKNYITKQQYNPIRYFSTIGLDIFPLCGYPDDPKAQLAFDEEFMDLGEQWRTKVVIPCGNNPDFECHINTISQKMKEMFLRYNCNHTNYVGKGYCGYLVTRGDGCRAIRKEYYKDTVLKNFGESKYHVPIGFDSLLTKWYKNYMIIPNKENCKPHNSQSIYKC